MPDPLKLSATWWNYFSTKKDEDLKTGIQTFLDRVNEQLSNLPIDEQKKYQVTVKSPPTYWHMKHSLIKKALNLLLLN